MSECFESPEPFSGKVVMRHPETGEVCEAIVTGDPSKAGVRAYWDGERLVAEYSDEPPPAPPISLEDLQERIEALEAMSADGMVSVSADLFGHMARQAATGDPIAYCPTYPPWIPCAERLPVYEVDVLVLIECPDRQRKAVANRALPLPGAPDGYTKWNPSDAIASTWPTTHDCYLTPLGAVTHWMPLPEGPGGK